MNFLIAPNAMKGALSADQCARIIRKSLTRKYPQSEFILSPIADGGNGTLDCLLNALGGAIVEAEISEILFSEKITARYGILPDNKTAIIESAEAIGLHKISPSPETIAHATSRGLGELMKDAVEHGCTTLIIGLGGSATNDGGTGMAKALGIDLLDTNGKTLKDGVLNLVHLAKFNPALPSPYRGGFGRGQIIILSDVKNLLLGKYGATYTFAKQKGASEEQLPYLEASLKNYADIVEQTTGKDFRNIPGSGAAGGLGFGLMAFCNAEMISGIDFILDAIQFNEKLRSCDCVITCEGTIDEQTLSGKGIAGIAQRAKQFNKPVHTFVGKISGNKEFLMEKVELTSLTQISPNDISTEQAMKDASWLLADSIFNFDFT